MVAYKKSNGRRHSDGSSGKNNGSGNYSNISVIVEIVVSGNGTDDGCGGGVITVVVAVIV